MTSSAPVLSSPPPAPRRDWRAGWQFYRAQPLGIRLGVAVLLALALAWGAVLLWSPRGGSRNPLINTPVLALEGLQTKSLYYNGVAWGWLQQKRPDLLGADDRSSDTARVRGFTQAVQNPKLFRQLDRQYRFDKLLLIGDPTQYRPLLEHLLETHDWSPVYVDHTSLVFEREAPRAWKPEDLAQVETRLQKASRHDRAIFLSQVAGKLVAIRQPAAARAVLERAEALDAKLPELWSARAQYHLARGEWRETETAANRALALDRDNFSALGSKAQALYSTKRFNEAYAISRQLSARFPDDPAVLFYHAKIAHEARAYTEEIAALRHLIILAEANERPTSGYRVYLGQSLASSGDAPAALQEFANALADPSLPKDQRKFALDCIKLIRSQGK